MRSYSQFCPAARALDVVGERWTLLIVRDLLLGPKRYTDLQNGLAGIGPNVLTERLRTLEEAGVVRRRRLPPPAASTVYELTEAGTALSPIVEQLFHWGLRFAGAPARGDALRASWWLPAVRAAAEPGSISDEWDDAYEMRVGEEVLTVRVRDGAVETHEGPAQEPDLVLRTDPRTFAQLGGGTLSPLEAIEAGRLKVEGEEAAAERCAALFGMAEPAAPAASSA